MQADYIILGQGISGTLLSYQLIKEGKKVIVIDKPYQSTASRVASGLINPVTGKRIVKTWLIDELLPKAISIYRQLEHELGIAILKQCNVLEFFNTREEEQLFLERMEDEPTYLQLTDKTHWQSYFNFNHAIGKINPCMLVDLNILLGAWRKQLLESQSLIEEEFNWQYFSTDIEQVRYKDIKADYIICCEGTGGSSNPFFSLLPYSINKGEAVIASIPGLPRNNVYMQGLKIAPWQEDLFWIGSSFDWKYEDAGPTERFRTKVDEHLKYRLKLPYTITDHLAAERPSTVDYKPFVGIHPKYPRIGILNGMGTKGCSVAPYFADQLVQFLLYDSMIMPDVDVIRYRGVLNRSNV